MTDTTLRRSAASNLNMIGAEIQLTAASSGVVPDDMFTVTQAVNNIGFGRFQIVLSFVVGLCWMADSMEMMILSILPLALQCEWGINHYRQAFLTTIVFIGKGTYKYYVISLWARPPPSSVIRMLYFGTPPPHLNLDNKIIKPKSKSNWSKVEVWSLLERFL